MSVESRHSEFLILVGDMCLIAERAQLFVELEMSYGTRVSGIPSAVASTIEAPEVDDTGYGNALRIDDATIRLADVVGCAVRAPAAP